MKNRIVTIITGMVIALLSLSATIAYACIDNSGSTVGCDGTQNVFEPCGFTGWCPACVPNFINCTGTSPGSPYPDAGVGDSGKSAPCPWVGICSATIYYAKCCDGNITQGSVYGTYGYAYACGEDCGK
jgi:hypothetical protein